MGKIKVLVVDDHALMRDGVRVLLSQYEDIDVVDEASGGNEAIEKVKKLSLDVIIMDIAMPDMDGLEVTRRIIKINKKVKILIVTQYENKEHIISAIKAGATGYVPKRALSSELVSALRAVYSGEFFLYPSVAATLIEDYRQCGELDPYDSLNTREKEILELMAEGYTNKEIVEILDVALKTVARHRAGVMKKLDLQNRAGLIRYAVRKGLIKETFS